MVVITIGSWISPALARISSSNTGEICDLARIGKIPAVDWGLGVDSLPDPYIMLGCGGSRIFNRKFVVQGAKFSDFRLGSKQTGAH